MVSVDEIIAQKSLKYHQKRSKIPFFIIFSEKLIYLTKQVRYRCNTMIAKTGYWEKAGVWRSETVIDGKYHCGKGNTAEEAEHNLEKITNEKINHTFD